MECNFGECSRLGHLAGIARDNSKWHWNKFKETKDRYHLGQFKAYQRVYKRLITPEEGRKIVTYDIYPVRFEHFQARMPFSKEDAFCKTYVAKARVMGLWEQTWGILTDQGLLRAAITVTENRRAVTNLQLLHTMFSERGQGLGKYLCEWALRRAFERDQKYFRVSAEVDAVKFYQRIGYKFLGRQKSGCQLSIFKIGGPEITDAIYDPEDPVIQSALNSRARGGVVERFYFERKHDDKK